jgi:tRNA threonylcarbamoyladenosine biosynthesis protein TsaB
VRVLGIETTSRRGTVALLENESVIAIRVHDSSSSHGEVMLPLIGELFSDTGWPRTSLDRIAAGTGPGSFTGIRVGLAVAKGLGLGLDRPVFGVGSLRAMCRAVPLEVPGSRCAVLDGRREELFVGVYGADGAELEAPRIIPREHADSLAAIAKSRGILLGEVLGGMPGLDAFRSELTDLPHAVGVALAGAESVESDAPAEPFYLRPVDAIPSGAGSPVSSKRAR